VQSGQFRRLVRQQPRGGPVLPPRPRARIPRERSGFSGSNDLALGHRHQWTYGPVSCSRPGFADQAGLLLNTTPGVLGDPSAGRSGFAGRLFLGGCSTCSGVAAARPSRKIRKHLTNTSANTSACGGRETNSKWPAARTKDAPQNSSVIDGNASLSRSSHNGGSSGRPAHSPETRIRTSLLGRSLPGLAPTSPGKWTGCGSGASFGEFNRVETAAG